MEERAVHISSVKRGILGSSKPEDFTIKFNAPIELDESSRNEIALDVVSMTYS